VFTPFIRSDVRLFVFFNYTALIEEERCVELCISADNDTNAREWRVCMFVCMYVVCEKKRERVRENKNNACMSDKL